MPMPALCVPPMDMLKTWVTIDTESVIITARVRFAVSARGIEAISSVMPRKSDSTTWSNGWKRVQQRR